MFFNRFAGFEFVKKLIAQHFKVWAVFPKNKGRHLLVQGIDLGGKNVYFYILFKHSFIHSFNYLFPSFVDKFPFFAGQGESINVEWLDYLCKNYPDARILYVYEDQTVYEVVMNPLALKKFCVKNGLKRVQDKENETKYSTHIEKYHEQEYCFPIAIMERYV